MNIRHDLPGAIPEHTPDIAASCPDCKRIAAFLKAYREFGYSTLTRQDMSDSYERAMKGEQAGDIIAMLARRELLEAGIVKEDQT